MHAVVRWMQSELNSADGPSRIYDPRLGGKGRLGVDGAQARDKRSAPDKATVSPSFSSLPK
eukprot:5694667-Pyramimonas_sp.AAC.1